MYYKEEIINGVLCCKSTKCKEVFDNPNKFFGGMFDWVMTESGCSSK